MNLKEITEAYLREKGYDGLYDTDTECACSVDALFPCVEPGIYCEAGYSRPCDCGDHNWHIGPERAAGG